MSRRHHRHRRNFTGEADRLAFFLHREFLKASNPNAMLQDEELRFLNRQLREEICDTMPMREEAGRAPAELFKLFVRKKIRPPRRTVKKIFELAAVSIEEQSTSTLLVAMHQANILGLPLPAEYLEAVRGQTDRIINGGHDGQVLKFIQGLAESDAIGSFYVGQNFPSVQKEIYKKAIRNDRLRDLLMNPSNTDRQNISTTVCFWFEGKYLLEAPIYDDKPTRFEHGLVNVISHAGARQLNDMRSPVTKHRFDATMALQDKASDFPDRIIYVEADGPEHLLISTDGKIWHYNGKTVAQTAMRYKEIQKVHNGDATILRVPYHVYDDFKGDPKFWRRLVNMIMDGAAGCLKADSTKTLDQMGRLGQLANTI